MLASFRCYTFHKVTEESIKKCTHYSTRKQGGIYKGKSKEKLWIIYYRSWSKVAGAIVLGHNNFTVIIGAETGSVSIGR